MLPVFLKCHSMMQHKFIAAAVACLFLTCCTTLAFQVELKSTGEI